MIKVNVAVDSDLLQQLADSLESFGSASGAAFPLAKIAFDESVRYIQGVWKSWATGDPLTGITKIKNPSQRLANSIRIKQNGPFNADIYTESEYAQRIKNGQPELDMKTTHPYGPKSRVSKEGIPYLIVPFRWGTPNAKGGKRAHFANFIPVSMFSKIKKMKTSKRLAQFDKEGNITGGKTHFEENYAGNDIERSDYAWGGRHNGDGNMDGMVRMAGGGGYFTFRVISAAQLVTSPYSWIRKAVPPIDIVSALENTVRPIVEDVIQAGFEDDIAVMD
jgi:hypothetical protein